MVQFRKCPGCRGGLDAEKGMCGEYIECLQCGYMQDLVGETSKLADSVKTAERSGGKKTAA